MIYETFKREGYQEFYPGLDVPEEEPKLRYTFQHAFISVVTRCFGWGLPKTSLIPFADCINHHNVDSTYELIHLKYHQDLKRKDSPLCQAPNSYFSPSKIEGDYSDFFNELQSSPNVDEESQENYR